MDKGVKKAFTSQTRPHLASNFTYRTMERIRLETARKEARRERRSFVWILVCAFVMLGSCLGIMIEACGIRNSNHSVRRRLLPAYHSLPAFVGSVQLLAEEEIQEFVGVRRTSSRSPASISDKICRTSVRRGCNSDLTISNTNSGSTERYS